MFGQFGAFTLDSNMAFKLLLLGIIVHLQTFGSDGQTDRCYNGVILQNTCYYVSMSNGTYNDGASTCQSKGGRLASITDSHKQNRLESLMKSLSIETVYISLQQYPGGTEWYWHGDTSLRPSSQGCYNNGQAGDTELYYEVDTTVTGIHERNTPFTCRDTCRGISPNFTVSAVREGKRCLCGRGFGSYGTATPCTTACTGNKDDSRHESGWCGGMEAAFVYLTDTTALEFGVWGYGEPNNFKDYQDCMALLKTLNYKFGDERCTKNNHNGDPMQFICQMPVTHSCSGVGYRRFQRNSGYPELQDESLCLYMGTNDGVPRDFYQAQEVCESAGGGTLVQVTSNSVWAACKETIRQLGRNTEMYWTGLTKGGGWRWPDGSKYSYTNWAPSKPSSRSRLCVTVSASNQYQWVDADCGERHHFVCMGGENIAPTAPPAPSTTTTTTTMTTTTTPTTTITPSTPSTSTSTTTTPTPPTSTSSTTTSPITSTITTTKEASSTPKPTTLRSTVMPTSTSTAVTRTTVGITDGNATTPGNNATDPDIGQSTDNETTIGTVEIVLIVLAILLFLICLITFFCILYYMKMRKKQKVGYMYDARPKAPVPNSEPVIYDSDIYASVGSHSTDTLRENRRY